MWFVTSRRHEHEINALKGRLAQAIEQRDSARSERQAFRSAAQTASRQFADADAATRRLHDRVEELKKRLDARPADGTKDTARLENRITRLRKIVSRLLEERRTATRRADRLQARLDDAVGLPPRGPIVDSSAWQPGYQPPKPKAGAS